MHQTILIIDFGSQYTQLIARRVRELNVYCEIYPFHHFEEALSKIKGIKGVILLGSPASVRDSGSPQINVELVRKKFTVLAVGYGAQLIAQQSGGEVRPSSHREYGRANLSTIKDGELFSGMHTGTQVWMSHADTITKVRARFTCIASTSDVDIAAFKIEDEKPFGIQFHPEVTHTTEGKILLKNFVYNICGCAGDWTATSFVEDTVQSLKEKIKDEKVILAISGGVDSTVAAGLLNRAVGKNLHCVFVDNGLLRKNEFNTVLATYKSMGLNVTGVDAKKKFYDALRGGADPEQKRKIIGNVAEEKVKILQAADDIFISALKEKDLYHSVWQAATMLLPVQTVGVMGDERTYENVIALRAVNSVDGMTADWSKLPHDFLAMVSSAIINKVKGINRVVYDISSKPPATIEWE